RIRARVEQRFHHVEVGGGLLLRFLRLRKARARLPLRADGGPQRRDAVTGGDEVRIGLVPDEEHGHVELTVDGGHQQRRRRDAGIAACTWLAVGCSPLSTAASSTLRWRSVAARSRAPCFWMSIVLVVIFGSAPRARSTLIASARLSAAA